MIFFRLLYVYILLLLLLYRPLTAIQPGHESETRFLPLDESHIQDTLFYIGNHIDFQAKYSGSLICFANDAHSEYWNNIGIIEVQVSSRFSILILLLMYSHVYNILYVHVVYKYNSLSIQQLIYKHIMYV